MRRSTGTVVCSRTAEIIQIDLCIYVLISDPAANYRYFVGNVRASDSGNCSPVVEGTVDANEPAMRISWADVVKGTRGQQMSKCHEYVSRAHSLETIPLVKRV